MKVVYLSDHRWRHGTETHIALTLEAMGHQVVCIAERSIDARPDNLFRIASGADLFLYTRSHGFPPEQRAAAIDVLDRLTAVGIPTVSYHLDLYLGLQRADTLDGDPFWATDWVFTPDGDPASEAEFERRGIRHVWMPPAVYGPECVPGTPRPEFAHDVVFVGSYPYPHPEWAYRNDLVEHVQARYGPRFARYGAGARTVRNGLSGEHDTQLNDLYASAGVVVGDSLCPGFTKPRYWSDRLTETLGRGGVLVWPRIDGVAEQGFMEGEHFLAYDFGDFDALDAQINRALADPGHARAMALRGQAFVRDHHTYEHRMTRMLELVAP